MNINIDTLTESELRNLNRRIVARLKMMQQLKTQAAMMEFQIGDYVCFCDNTGCPIWGTITKYNKKTVTVISDHDEHWNVSPVVLKKIGGNVVEDSTVEVVPNNLLELKP